MPPAQINCRPIGICSWNFRLTAETHHAELHFAWLREQGTIAINGHVLTVAKPELFRGQWILEDQNRILHTARKSSPLSRTFAIESADGSHADLRACSAFARGMTLRGPRVDCRIKPVHSLTRRATIRGTLPDFTLACLAFWLTLITWRRGASAGTSSPGAT